jgi:hypothetical protein
VLGLDPYDDLFEDYEKPLTNAFGMIVQMAKKREVIFASYFEVQAILADHIHLHEMREEIPKLNGIQAIALEVAQEVLFHFLESRDLVNARNPPLPGYSPSHLFKQHKRRGMLHVSTIKEFLDMAKCLSYFPISSDNIDDIEEEEEKKKVKKPDGGMLILICTEPSHVSVKKSWASVMPCCGRFHTRHAARQIPHPIYMDDLNINAHLRIPIRHHANASHLTLHLHGHLEVVRSLLLQFDDYFIRRTLDAITLTTTRRMVQLLVGPLSAYFLKRFHAEPCGQFWLTMLKNLYPADRDARALLYWFILYQFDPSVRLEDVNVEADLEKFLRRFTCDLELWKTMIYPLTRRNLHSMLYVSREDGTFANHTLKLAFDQRPTLYTALSSLLRKHSHYFVPGEFVDLPRSSDTTFFINGRPGWRKISVSDAHSLYEHGTNLNVLMWMVGSELVTMDCTDKGEITDFVQNWDAEALPCDSQTILSFKPLPNMPTQNRDFAPVDSSKRLNYPEFSSRLAFFIQALEHLFSFGVQCCAPKSMEILQLENLQVAPLFCRGVMVCEFDFDFVLQNHFMFVPWKSLEPLNISLHPILVILPTLKRANKWQSCYYKEALNVDQMTPDNDPLCSTWLTELDVRTLPIWAPITDIQGLEFFDTCRDRINYFKRPADVVIPRLHTLPYAAARDCVSSLPGAYEAREIKRGDGGGVCVVCGDHDQTNPCLCEKCLSVRAFPETAVASDIRVLPLNRRPVANLQSDDYHRFLYADGRHHWTSRGPPCVHAALPTIISDEFKAFILRASSIFSCQ